MLNVRKDICAGCGVCSRVCPTEAISLDEGTAHIDQAKCTSCYRCIQACPRKAIVAVGKRMRPAALSAQELRDSLLHLREELQAVTQRLQRLEQRKAVKKDATL